MTVILWSLAWATCPEPGESLRAARSAFDEAELDEARGRLAQGFEGVLCQPRRVEPTEVVKLYQLSGLVALAEGREDEAIQAVMSAIAIDPLAVPPASDGVELTRLHRAWAGRMTADRVTVTVRGGGVVHVDGRALTHDQQLDVVAGRHLVQIQQDDRFKSYLDVFRSDATVATGIALPAVAEPSPQRLEDPPPLVVERKRVRPPGLRIASAIVGAVGVGLVVASTVGEGRFKRTDYQDLRALDRDAVWIRAGYASGYTGAVLGGVGLTVAAIGLPPRRRP